jgi:PilZ domain-containing protein
MENQMELPGMPQTVQGSLCSSEACSEPAVADFDARHLCIEHFLIVCFQELEARNERLKNQPVDTETDSFRRFLSASVEQVRKLSEIDQFSDAQTKSQLLEFLLRASQLSKGLRRSPRRSSSVPVWLRREDPSRTWEEETWTVTVSQHGAGLVCRHPVEAGGKVVLCRRDKGSRVQARVVYCRYDGDGRRQIGVELLDRDDFWD